MKWRKHRTSTTPVVFEGVACDWVLTLTWGLRQGFILLQLFWQSVRSHSEETYLACAAMTRVDNFHLLHNLPAFCGIRICVQALQSPHLFHYISVLFFFLIHVKLHRIVHFHIVCNHLKFYSGYQISPVRWSEWGHLKWVHINVAWKNGKKKKENKERREKIMFNFLHGEYSKAWNYIQSSAAQAGLVCMEPISWVWLGEGCVCVCVCTEGYGSEGSDIVLSAQEEEGMPKSRTLETEERRQRQLRSAEEQRKTRQEQEHLWKQLNASVGHWAGHHDHLDWTESRFCGVQNTSPLLQTTAETFTCRKTDQFLSNSTTSVVIGDRQL